MNPYLPVRWKQMLVLWITMGMVYMTVEGLWRGWTHISMLAVGGLCGLCIGAINQMPRFYNMKIIFQSIIGAAVVTVIEFFSGCVINLWLGMGVWDYTGMAGNILGQVCLPYSLYWLLLMPFAIWVEDALRYYLWRQGEYYSPFSVYRDFFTLR